MAKNCTIATQEDRTKKDHGANSKKMFITTQIDGTTQFAGTGHIMRSGQFAGSQFDGGHLINKYRNICRGLWLAAGLIMVALATVSAKAYSSPYLQGSLGYGLISDIDATTDTNDGTGNQLADTLTSEDNALIMGVEAGMDRLGAGGNLRAGFGYQTFDGQFKSSDGTLIDSEITLTSINGYYYLAETMVSGYRLHPYVGAGLGWLEVGNLADTETAYLFHAGADMPWQQNVTIGGKYSYVTASELTPLSSTGYSTLKNFSTHIFSANVTYHFNGGLGGMMGGGRVPPPQ